MKSRVFCGDRNADLAPDRREFWETAPCCGGHIWRRIGTDGLEREVSRDLAMRVGPAGLRDDLNEVRP